MVDSPSFLEEINLEVAHPFVKLYDHARRIC
jgi:hypothetical protein